MSTLYLMARCTLQTESVLFDSFLLSGEAGKLFSIDRHSVISIENKLTDRESIWYFSIPFKLKESFLGFASLRFPCICIQVISTEIDWEKQSQDHSPFWSGEKALLEVPLVGGCKKLFLEPGYAFGDGSHPTTRLMLESMEEVVNEAITVDIGTGNGILALAALHCGAYATIGLDIDSHAILLAQKNADKNYLTKEARFFSTEEIVSAENHIHQLMRRYSRRSVILMNMTWGDIQAAIPMYEKLIQRASEIVISGIISRQKEEVQRFFYEKYDYTLIKEVEEDGWLLLHFHSSKGQ